MYIERERVPQVPYLRLVPYICVSSVACKIVNFIINYKNEKSKSRFLL